MPAVSKQQQQFMGIVHAIQKGEMKPSGATPAARAAAKSMKKKDVEDFAATKHKGLPEEVPENEAVEEAMFDKVRSPSDKEYKVASRFADDNNMILNSLGVDKKTGNINVKATKRGRSKNYDFVLNPKGKKISGSVGESVNEIKSDKDMVKDGLKYAKKKYKYGAKQTKELAKEMLQCIKSGEIDDQASMEAYIDFYNDGMTEGSFKGSIAQDARGLGLKTLSDLTKITDRKKIQKIQNDFVKFSMTNKNKYKDWYTAWKAFWDQNKLKEIIRNVVKEILTEGSTGLKYDEWQHTKTQAKNIFRMLKQKHKNNIPKMKKGLESILKQNKIKDDQTKIVWQEFNKYFKIK